MNKLKRTLALVATLAISATAFVGCGSDDSSSTASSSSSEAESSAESSESSEAESSEGEAESTGSFTYSGSLPTDGDQMTVLCWTGDDLDVMLSTWEAAEGIDAAKVNFKNFQVGGGEAAAQYDQYFLGGEDVDMLMVEADWALKYINDDTATAPLSDLGFTDADFAGQYAYTMEVGKDSNGVIKATSWQAAPGGWCYRTDLAESYLGVTTPDEMQAKVSDWDAFQATAAEVSEKSGGATALTTTLGGIWQAFAANRTQPWVVDGALAVDDFCNTFIDLAKNMRDNGYVTEANQWTDEWYAAGQTDDTMGYFVSTWGFGAAILETAAGGEGGATYGKWNVCQGPTPYYWGGTWACVSPKCDNGDMVANFMNYFTIDETSMKEYALAKPDYVNNMNAMQAIVDEGSNSNALLGGQDQFAVLHEAAKNINLNGLITPYDASIKQAFLDAVNAYCAGETADADACLDDFKNRVAESVTDITVE
ncbi:MAG: carbohydrate ABC transporter substrate-binding protein [Porcipelethomonas sp.]